MFPNDRPTFPQPPLQLGSSSERNDSSIRSNLPREASIKVRKTEYKQVLKARAMENLKDKRKLLRDQVRDPFAAHHQVGSSSSLEFNPYDEYMNACRLELERLMAEDKGSMTDDEYNELLWELQQEIENEFQEEDEEQLREYEEQQRLEAQDMDELINFYEKSVFLCPVCKKNNLHETKHSLCCKCGLRIPTSLNGLSVKFVSQQVIDCYGEHKLQCNKEPKVLAEQRAGMTFVTLRCDHCDFLEIIV
ncbi:hypothetical protein FDP41_009390 [Naegleria fowleri]|uniref:RPA-interacting protein C-terminal domain-containing protein n=1 Tax=Naegleria fowleri TaxID=5763 RepID=A0A6A5B2S6_NAEFO|nr:uncharacterized protein FDP41_009390 [Naegleria fowleri]KAF0972487.1 hypothetical protein FDP41_009390 [Naegleria fowleri]